MCEMVLAEEVFFRRNDRYRLSSFADAEREVYADKAFMTRYMNGLLLSQVWWHNHSAVMRYYQDHFLPNNIEGFKHLEIGPGHGLYLVLAANSPKCASANGWDVSESSVALTQHATNVLDPRQPITLSLVNMFDAREAHFDSIVFSEVLEHLEEPKVALDAIYGHLNPGGRAFINAPCNSPAPDHLSLFRAPEEIVELVKSSGFEIEDTLFAPTTGATLERARKRALAISTVVVARKPK
jgi:2-polyprenyl-3-methyl-5-hydroxy-6-metoxy-1,4-benzoquinol methylase